MTAAGTDRQLDAPDLAEPVGQFEATICSACGFVDWYVLDPASIPIGAEYGTQLVDLRNGGPYR